jgi:hypothetical protein
MITRVADGSAGTLQAYREQAFGVERQPGTATRADHRPKEIVMRLQAVSLAALLVSAAMTPAAAVGSQSGHPTVKNSDPQSVDNLDPKILAIMRHQERLQPAVQALYGEHVKDEKTGFAGLRFEGGGLTLYYKGDLTAGFREAFNEASRAGSLQLKSAAYSLAELKADGERIYASIKQHGLSDIQSIGYSPDGSGLKIELLPQPAANAQAGYAAERGLPAPVQGDVILRESNLQVSIEVTTATKVFMPASRLIDSPPWNGGARWYSTRNGVFRADCTTGFGVNASGRSWVLTAAHCASLGDTAYQGSSGSGKLMGPINSDQRDYDMLLIDAPGWYHVFDGGPTTSNVKKATAGGIGRPANSFVTRAREPARDATSSRSTAPIPF